jgi:hypothetical protein
MKKAHTCIICFRLQSADWQHGPESARRQAKLARSAGASPAQVRPSKSPGSECCVRRRQRRTRSVHSGCVGCVIEPRNDEFAGAETVVMVERNMCNADMRGLTSCRPLHDRVPLPAVSSLGGFRTPAPGVPGSLCDGPASEILHKSSRFNDHSPKAVDPSASSFNLTPTNRVTRRQPPWRGHCRIWRSVRRPSGC